MIFFLHGEDEFLVHRRRLALQKAFAKKYAGAEFFIFDFEDQGTTEDVRRALGSCESGLFAGEKMVVFLHPFVLGEGAEKILIQFLKKRVKESEERTILLFVHTGKLKKTHPLASVLLKVADKEEIYDKIQGEEKTFIQKELKEFNPNVSFAPGALGMFLSVTGSDSARMVSELEKLATFKETGVIEEGDIELLLSSALPEANAIFTALDTLGRGNKKQALMLLEREARKLEGAFPVLSLCAWQVRRLLLVRDAYDRGVRRSGDIASVTKLPPFVVQKMLATIEHFPLSRIKRGLVLLSDIDTNLKQGKADPNVSLDLFVWKF